MAKRLIEAVGEIDEFVSTECVMCFHFWLLRIINDNPQLPEVETPNILSG